MTTDLNPEGLERAAEALHNEKYPAWLWGTNEELQQHYRGHVTAAVSAYLGHTEVTTVEELDALPNHSVILCATDTVWRVATFPEGKQWISTTYAYSRPSGDINLPATVLHRPAP